jgi:tRNA-specific 2-thiouridylase
MNIYVAMSGGVDSAVTAALLKKQGHNVTGVTMNLTGNEHVQWAEMAAQMIGIPLEVIDMRERFRKTVIDSFVKSYAAGLTPNPCVLCNFEIKFGALLDIVIARGAEKLATGHYARIENRRLLKGLDEKKDQSYFLYRLHQAQLELLTFPLGGMTKEEVKQIARDIGLPQADKEESQDVCFIPGGNCGEFLANIQGGRREPGEIVDENGRVLGRHNGICAYTVGQRKGLGLGGTSESASDTEPLYVLAIDADSKRVVVGPRDKGYSRSVKAVNPSWISGHPPTGAIRVEAKVRYNSKPAPAAVSLDGQNAMSVDFDEPQFAPAPGQSIVFYNGEDVLGGAVITG